MAWKESSVSEQRLALVQLMQNPRPLGSGRGRPVWGQPQDAYKWLARAQDAGTGPTADQPLPPPPPQPRAKPADNRASHPGVREPVRLGGAEDLRLLADPAPQGAARPTVHQVLCRHGRVGAPPPRPLRCRSNASSGASPTSCGNWTSRGRWRLAGGSGIP